MASARCGRWSRSPRLRPRINAICTGTWKPSSRSGRVPGPASRVSSVVRGLAGFTPPPYQSGESAREQGITKAGNRHVRWMTTELAWSWLRFQPDSALSVWFRERFGSGGKRLRRIGIVAVARKLLIALWRFLETGVLPAGAVLKEG